MRDALQQRSRQLITEVQSKGILPPPPEKRDRRTHSGLRTRRRTAVTNGMPSQGSEVSHHRADEREQGACLERLIASCVAPQASDVQGFSAADRSRSLSAREWHRHPGRRCPRRGGNCSPKRARRTQSRADTSGNHLEEELDADALPVDGKTEGDQRRPELTGREQFSSRATACRRGGREELQE